MRRLRHNSLRSALVCALFVSVVAGAMGGVLRAQTTQDAVRREQTVMRVPRAEMPQGPQGRRYTQTFPVFGGVQPYTFTVTGATPAGMHWATADNGMVLDGVPRTAGRFPIAVTVTDAAGQRSAQAYVLDITSTDTGDSVNVPVTEAVSVTDVPSVGFVIQVGIAEPISVTDVPSAALPLQVNVSEAISVTDIVGAAESVLVAISEPISVSDMPSVALPLQVNVSEAISVTDMLGTSESVVVAIAEPITVTDVPSVALPLQVNVSEAISVSDMASTTESVVVAISEPISVTDTPLASPPLQVSVSEAISVSDMVGTTESVFVAISEPITVTDAPTAAPATPVTPVVTWNPPPSIVYGTATSVAQQTATANVPGTFFYTTPNGTVFGAGTHPMGVAFIPTDQTNYQPVSAYTTITVTQATPVVIWNAPPSIVYGTALSSAQQTAKANVPGSFFYTAANGTVFPAGTHPLGAAFTPTDTTDYKQVSAYTTITVTQATPVITWPAPAAITYGTPLSAVQLNATANVPGSFFYVSPAGINPTGALLPAGVSPLGAGFTPADGTDYTPTSAYVTIAVNKAATTTTLAVTVSQTIAGTTATLTATVHPQIGGTPTGTVTYYSGSTALGSAAVDTPFTTGVLPVGTDKITAVYSGDANFTGSSSATTAVVASRRLL